MTKQEIAQSCVVPETLKNDKYEPVTQAEYTTWLVRAITRLGLTTDELESIRDGKMQRAELVSILHVGRDG